MTTFLVLQLKRASEAENNLLNVILLVNIRIGFDSHGQQGSFGNWERARKVLEGEDLIGGWARGVWGLGCVCE